MVSDDPLATFARCRALALAAMIEAGGKPCWVASGPAAAAPAAAPDPVPLSTREVDRLAGLPPRVRDAIERALGHLHEAAKAAAAPAAAASAVQARATRPAIVPPKGPRSRNGRVRSFERF